MLIYLDTNILVWLHAKKKSSFSPKVLKLMENNELITGEINLLELEFLYEIGRIDYNGKSIYNSLKTTINLQLVGISSKTIFEALDIKWTRDLFDRITVAGAMALGIKLITKDAVIIDNYDLAVW